MSEKDIREYAKLMKELGLTGIEVDMNTGSFRLERNEPVVSNAAPVFAGAPQVVTAVQQAVPETISASQAPSTLSESADTSAQTRSELFEVKSPIVGIFYQAPMENADPFVKVGDHVNEGDVLCIVEAMKLMNEITAEKSGRIAEVCATDGTPVDFNCTLFRIEEE